MFSPIFSVPRCKKPMSQSQSFTVSPSRRRMTRSTPWVLGCWGPMLMMSSSVPGTTEERSTRVEDSTSNITRPPSIAVFLAPGLGVHPLPPPLQGVFLAEGVAAPVLGDEDAPQVRVALEGHPEQVVHLPLHPVGPAPDGHDRGHLLPVAGLHLEPEPPVMVEAVQVVDHVERPLIPGVVDRREIREQAEPRRRVVAQQGARLDQGVHPD